MKLAKMSKIKIIGDRYYLMEFYEAENYIASRIVKLNDLERRKLPKIENKINQLELIMGITYDESQREAISKFITRYIGCKFRDIFIHFIKIKISITTIKC